MYTSLICERYNDYYNHKRRKAYIFMYTIISVISAGEVISVVTLTRPHGL